jgi:hypothetical protein
MQRRDYHRLLSSSEIVYHVLMSALIIYHLDSISTHVYWPHTVLWVWEAGETHLFTFIHVLIVLQSCTACWFTAKVTRCNSFM